MEPKEFTAETKKMMNHGTVNKINALVTLASEFLPLYYPSLVYCEEGVYVMECDEKPLLAVSPDGSIREILTGNMSVGKPRIGIEVKCPYPNSFTTPVHYTMPERYVSQVLAEMKALDVERLLYVSYSSEGTTVFDVTFDADLFQLMMNEAYSTYGNACPRRPSSITSNTKTIKAKLKDFLRENVSFVAELPSLVAKEDIALNSTEGEESPHLFSWNVHNEIMEQSPVIASSILSEAKRVIGECYQICRLKGTEVVAFLLSDVNRNWHVEIPHSVPVAFGLKGYSQTAASMRSMIETVLQECHKNNIYVPCITFDGQWSGITTRDAAGNPLTKLQVQKDIWSKAKKASKPSIVTYLKGLSHGSQIECKKDKDTGAITLEHPDKIAGILRTPSTRSLWIGSNKKVNEQEEEATMTVSAALECLPEDVLDSDDVAELVGMATTSNNQSEEIDDDRLDEDVLPDLPPVIDIPPLPVDISSDKGTSATPVMPVITLSPNYCKEIIEGWIDSEKNKPRKRWEDVPPSDVPSHLRDSKTIKQLNMTELDIVIVVTTPLHNLTAKKSWQKWRKVNFLSQLFEDKSTLEQPKPRKPADVRPLRELASRILSNKKYPKAVLNTVFAREMSGAVFQEWEEKQSVQINGLESTKWYYHPEIRQTRNQLEVKVLDGHHLLVNLRVKVCKDGLTGYKIRKEAWHAVAEKKPDVISKALVSDLTDRQSGFLPVKHFHSLFKMKYDFIRIYKGSTPPYSDV